MSRHAAPTRARHRAPGPADDLPSLDDWPAPLDEVTRLAAAAQKRLDDHRAAAPAPTIPELNPEWSETPTWDQVISGPLPPRNALVSWRTIDREPLHTVRLGEIHAEPPTWGGRGVRL